MLYIDIDYPLTKLKVAKDTDLLFKIMHDSVEVLAKMEKEGKFIPEINPFNISCFEGKVDIIDLGIPEGSMYNVYYSDSYSPPEIRYAKDRSVLFHKINVYCWGVTMYQLITGKNIKEIKGETDKPEKFYLSLSSVTLPADKEGIFTRFFISILKAALDPNPYARPSFEEIYNRLETDKSFSNENKESINMLRESIKEMSSKIYQNGKIYANKEVEYITKISELEGKITNLNGRSLLTIRGDKWFNWRKPI